MRLFPVSVVLLGVLASCQAPPGEVQIEIQPAEPTTVDALEVVILSESVDPNGKDTVSYRMQWFQSGTIRSDLDGTGVPSDQTAKGEVWKVYVTPTDGTLDGLPASAEVTVLNTVPVVESLAVEPGSPETVDDVQAVAIGSDADQDPVTFEFVWTVAGSETVVEGDTLPAVETERSQVWTLTATPGDGEGSGADQSLEVVIGNTAPTITAITLSPTDPTTTDAVSAVLEGLDSDGDAISATCDWTVAGVGVFQETVDLSAGTELDSSYTSKDITVGVSCVPSDGLQDGDAFVSDTVVVVNTAPSITGVSIQPVGVFESTTATCTPEGWVDVDSDAEGYTWSWTVDGVDPGVTTGTLTGADFNKLQVLTCTATPDDGEDVGLAFSSAQVVVENSAPSITSVTLSNAAPQEADVIGVLVTGANDDDGDLVIYEYEWSVNGSPVAYDTSLAGAWFDRGDTIVAMVTPTDGDKAGVAVMSNTGTAINTAPELLSLTFQPTELYTDTLVTVLQSMHDPDPADVGVISYTYEWYVDGAPVGTGTTNDYLSGTTWFDKHQAVHVRVTPSDGLDSGSPLNSSSVTVLNSAPEAPVLSVTPAEPVPGVDDVVCEVATPASDADGDPLTYQFEWLVDGAGWPGTFGQGATDATFYNEDLEYGWTVTCRAYATDDDGALGPNATGSVSTPTNWTLAYSEDFSSNTPWSSLACAGAGCPTVSGGAYQLVGSWNQILTPALGIPSTVDSWAVQFDLSLANWDEFGMTGDVSTACYTSCATTFAYWYDGTLSVAAEGGTVASASLDFATALSSTSVTLRLEVDEGDDTTCLYEVVGGVNQELVCATGTAAPPGQLFFQLGNGAGTLDNFEVYVKDVDEDGDGYTVLNDCDDDDATVWGGSTPCVCLAVEMDGVDDAIEFSDNIGTMFPIGNWWTGEVWFKVDSFATDDRILGTSDNWLDLRFQSDGSLLFYRWGKHGYSGGDCEGRTVVSDGGWHHVAFYTDDGAEPNQFGMYVDGELDCASEALDFPSDFPSNSLYLGANQPGVSPMDGVLGGFRLSSGPRYSGSFTPDPELPVDGTTLVRLGFEEGAGNTLSDQSSGAFDGTILGNAAWLSTCPEEDLDGDGIESWMDCDDSDATLTVPDGSANCPGLSCREILDNDASVVDGTYWIDPNGTGAFEVYCDMSTDGGGWTVVSYMPDAGPTTELYTSANVSGGSCADQSGFCKLSDDEINGILGYGGDTSDRFRAIVPGLSIASSYYWDTDEAFAYDNNSDSSAWFDVATTYQGAQSGACRHANMRGVGYYPAHCAFSGDEVYFFHDQNNRVGWSDAAVNTTATWYAR